MSALNSPAEILRAALLNKSGVSSDLARQDNFDLEVLEHVYTLIKPRLDYLRGFVQLHEALEGDHEYQLLRLVELNGFYDYDDNIVRLKVEVGLTRGGKWWVKTTPQAKAATEVRLEGAGRNCVGYIANMAAGLQLHNWKRQPRDPSGGPVGSVALELADALVAALDKSIKAKQSNLSAEQQVFEQLTVLMSRFRR